MSDREMVQLVCAFRILFPDVGLVLSTREPAQLRDGLIPLGITLVSAGSHTEPGGYTGAGRDHLHQTVRGRIIDLSYTAAKEIGIVGPGTARVEVVALGRQRSTAGGTATTYTTAAR